MKYYKIVALNCIMVFILSLVSCALNHDTESNVRNSSFPSSTSSKFDYYTFGKETKKYFSTSSLETDNLYMRGSHTSITQREIEKIVQEYRILYNINDAYPQAEKFLMRREAAYFEATQKGFCVTDKEVKDVIEAQKVELASAENREDIEKYLSGLEMTLEEYMESQKEQILKELVIAKYWDSEKKDFIEANSNLDLKEQEEKWKEEKEQRYKKLVSAQHFVKVTS